jgi:DNA polymerase III epsilon subunit-like protein
MSGLNFYIIDTETTGLSEVTNEVVQISIIRCSDRYQLTKNIKAEFPERASAEALRITNKTKEDLLKGDDKKTVVEICHNFMLEDGGDEESRCVVAHKASFDRKFCHALWQSVGKKFPANLYMCTVEYSRSWAKKLGIEKPKLTLEASLEFTGTKRFKGAHEAGVDAKNTYMLWKNGMDQGIDHLPVIKRVPHEF